MTAEQKACIRGSFSDLEQAISLIDPAPEALEIRLVASLSRLAPEDAALISLGQRFAAALPHVLDRLDRLDRIIPILWRVGRQGRDGGIPERHLLLLRESLLDLLADHLGERFTEEARITWGRLLNLMVDAVRHAADLAE